MLTDAQRDICADLRKTDNEMPTGVSMGTKDTLEETTQGMSVNMENQRYVNRGLLDKHTGRWIGRTKKGTGITAKNIRGLSEESKVKWDQVEWKAEPIIGFDSRFCTKCGLSHAWCTCTKS